MGDYVITNSESGVSAVIANGLNVYNLAKLALVSTGTKLITNQKLSNARKKNPTHRSNMALQAVKKEPGASMCITQNYLGHEDIDHHCYQAIVKKIANGAIINSILERRIVDYLLLNRRDVKDHFWTKEKELVFKNNSNPADVMRRLFPHFFENENMDFSDDIGISNDNSD